MVAAWLSTGWPYTQECLCSAHSSKLLNTIKKILTRRKLTCRKEEETKRQDANTDVAKHRLLKPMTTSRGASVEGGGTFRLAHSFVIPTGTESFGRPGRLRSNQTPGLIFQRKPRPLSLPWARGPPLQLLLTDRRILQPDDRGPVHQFIGPNLLGPENEPQNFAISLLRTRVG